MGRPIKKLFIGNRNPGGVGGESIAAITLGGTNNSTGYTAEDALTISAPQLPDGTQAVAKVATVSAGAIATVEITNAGSGYTSAPTIIASSGTIGNLTLTASLTTGTQPAIAIDAYVVGGSSALTGDIEAQKGSKTYRVKTSEGETECLLVTTAPNEGECRITGTDSAGGTYYVKKLFNGTIIVLPGTGTQFDEDDRVQWADTAVENVSIKITS